jgi:plastocyanin
MISRRLVLAALAAASAISLLHRPVLAAGGTITGTVKIPSVGSNADAVVYVERAAGTFKAPAAPATVDQRNMKFVPHVLPVLVGTTVRFLNSDSTQHNVFSPDYEKYDLGTWGQGQTKDHVFAKCAKAPCAYVQLCRVHPEMEGYVVVLDNPYFAVTGADGHYTIANVPPGSYTLGVWHEKAKAQPKPVTVGAATVTVDFTMGKK